MSGRMSESTGKRDITLLLKGGHVVKLGGPVDFEALVSFLREPPDEDGVVEIRTGGRNRLVVRDSAVVGVMEGNSDSSGQSDQLSEERPPATPYVVIEQFLQAEQRQHVISRVLQMEHSFETSKVTTEAEDFRKSILLMDDEVIGPMFRKLIRGKALEIAELLSVSLRTLPSDEAIECQITAHRDRGFFHAHNDSGSSTTASRRITFVYYFQTRPGSFFGGELKLYESSVRDEVAMIGPNFSLIPPRDNSIIFFPSQTWHEVLPTYVPSGAFYDSRFTVNGWIKSD
jgi:Rps23 Pro-64 3,4-dihydroxylase Tpa1-like proline 4-hydroxylase